MATRLRDVVVAQHRRLLTAIDHAEFILDDASIRRVRTMVGAHLDAEERLVYPLSEPLNEASRYGHEEHAVLRFALERVGAAETSVERGTRLRVLRDLVVHHMEREEWVTLQLLESRLDEATSVGLGRRLEAVFVSKPHAKKKAVPQARRKER